MSKFHTLDSVKKAAAGGSSAPKPPGGNTLYTGSGMNVIGREDEDDDDRDGDVFEKNRGKGQDEGAAGAVVIRFYKNGFVVSTHEGVLRDPATPENQSFIKSINEGYVPAELLAGRPPGAPEVHIDLEDHRSEVFVPPPYVAFGGAGASLGGGVGGGGRAAATAGAVVRPGAAPPAAAVDPALPVTTLQVKLLDGRKERLQFNLGHTVADLQARVLSLGASSGRAFILAAGFPPAPLSDPAATIEAAGLKGASVTQQLAPAGP